MSGSVVFILAADHSGSHLLAQLLGAHSRCVSIGELNHLPVPWTFGARNIVSDYATNPLFAGLAGTPERDWHAHILANATRYWPDVTTLIDNSKSVDWARQFTDAPQFNAHYIHLLRDPRALVTRWRARHASATERMRARRALLRRRRGRWLDALVRPMDVVWTHEWIAINDRIDGFLRGRRASIVIYDELAEDPRGCLTRLMAELGLIFEESQLAYGRAAHAGTLRRDYIGASARSVICPDRRWQTELTNESLQRVAGTRDLGRYLTRRNLALTDSGMRHIDTLSHQLPALQNVSSRRDGGPRS